MQPRRPLFLATIALVLGLGCSRARPLPHVAPHAAAASNSAVASASAAAAPAIPGVPLGDGEHTVGAPIVVDDVTIFPVYALQQEDLGDFATLEQALADKTAEVKELDATAPAPASNGSNAAPTGEARRPAQVAQRAYGYGDGAEVNRLVIANHGKLPILVLAGTIVKGGKQDRQIGADVIVEPDDEAKVAAFCVEPHRWTPSRDGKATGGTFEAQKTLAPSKVREQGQYAKDQSGVWSEVGKVNASSGKTTSTGTLLATLDDPAESARRETRAHALAAGLDRAPAPASIVGIAYGVGGDVRGARWFFHNKAWSLYRESLLATVSAERRIGAAAAPDAGANASACSQDAVVRFVSQLGAAPKTVQETPAANVNVVQEGDGAWGAAVELKAGKSFAKPPAAGAPTSKSKGVVTRDYLAK
jgi:hypothetical protein